MIAYVYIKHLSYYRTQLFLAHMNLEVCKLYADTSENERRHFHYYPSKQGMWGSLREVDQYYSVGKICFGIHVEQMTNFKNHYQIQFHLSGQRKKIPWHFMLPDTLQFKELTYEYKETQRPDIAPWIDPETNESYIKS